jgi:hypothetical protein
MFGLSLMHIAVLAGYAYLMCCYFKKGDMKMKGLLTVAVVLFLCMGSEGFDIKSLTDTMKTDVDKVKDDIKDYQKASNIGNNAVKKGPGDAVGGGLMGASLNPDSLNMSGYDGLCLKTGNQEYWMKSPDNTALVPNDTLYTYLGSEGPPKMRISDQSALTGPPIDGAKGSPEKMFMFANNVASPLCCPSTFSTSTGCICTTEAQRDYVAARGDNNDDYPTDSL